jgi:hypothetical protein
MAEDSGITWHVETHVHVERSVDWYWGLGIVALVGAGLSLFFGNLLFALIILIGAGSIGALLMRGPREHSCRLDPRGLSLDGTLYRWQSIDSFWVDDRKRQLLVSTRGILHPQLIIPLGDPTRAQNVRHYMRRHAQEEEQEAHLGEHIAEIFGL